MVLNSDFRDNELDGSRNSVFSLMQNPPICHPFVAKFYVKNVSLAEKETELVQISLIILLRYF